MPIKSPVRDVEDGMNPQTRDSKCAMIVFARRGDNRETTGPYVVHIRDGSRADRRANSFERVFVRTTLAVLASRFGDQALLLRN